MHDTLESNAAWESIDNSPQYKIFRSQSYRYWRHISDCVQRSICEECEDSILDPIESRVMNTQHMIWCQLRDDNESGV
jgi:hypothetical protein